MDWHGTYGMPEEELLQRAAAYRPQRREKEKKFAETKRLGWMSKGDVLIES